MQLPGTQLGPFYINREIGRGGMAIVYHAVDTRNGSDIALKILKPELTDDPTSVRRFAQEAKIALRLRHPNIIRTHEVDEIDGIRYMAMEYAEQGTLAAKLKEQRAPMSLAEATHLLRRIGMALDYAHNRSVLHRDVKPSNILMGRNGQCFLSDFGIARHLNENYTMLTGISDAIGTPSYMSPEQVQHDGDIDHRADIYSLGVVAYTLLTGKLPFEASTHVRVLHKIAYEAPIPPEKHNPKLTGGVCYALLRVLAKDPESRYQSAVEFVDALAEGEDWSPSKADWERLHKELNESRPTTEGNGNRRPNTPPARGQQRPTSSFQANRSEPVSQQVSEPGKTLRRSGVLVTIVLALLAVAGWWLLAGGEQGAGSTPPVAVIIDDRGLGAQPAVAIATLLPDTATINPSATAIDTPIPSDTLPVPTPTPLPAELQGAGVIATETSTGALSSPANKPATSTPVPDLPTETGTPMPLPTNTETARPAVTNTPRATLSPTVVVIAPTSTTNPGSGNVNVTVTLLEPAPIDTVSGRRTFRWQVSGSLPVGYAFEPVFYFPGQTATENGEGWGNTTTATELEIDATKHAPNGVVKWAVLLVETNPYRRVKLVSDEREIIVERSGGGGGGNESQPGQPPAVQATDTPKPMP